MTHVLIYLIYLNRISIWIWENIQRVTQTTKLFTNVHCARVNYSCCSTFVSLVDYICIFAYLDEKSNYTVYCKDFYEADAPLTCRNKNKIHTPFKLFEKVWKCHEVIKIFLLRQWDLTVQVMKHRLTKSPVRHFFSSNRNKHCCSVPSPFWLFKKKNRQHPT